MRAKIFVLTAILFAATPARAQTDQAAPQTPDAAQPPAPQNPPMTGPQILISTSMGDFTLQLDLVRAPKTAANIIRYVHERHYDGTVIYRVAKDFVIEMGSFDAKGQGRPVHEGVPLEAGNGLSNLRGSVALAHGDDPNSGMADFFINLADNSALDPGKGGDKIGFVVFAQVANGLDVLDRISQVPVGDNGPMPGQAPVDPILIKKVTVVGEPEPPPAKTPPKKRK